MTEKVNILKNRKENILCSGFGLGFYIPGLIVNYQLNKNNVPTEVLVFENYMVKEKKEKINDSKKAYHKNFSAALVAQRITSDIRKRLDERRVTELIEKWEKEEQRDFMVLSGHWVYIIEMYRQKIYPKPINVDLLYVDSDLSPSWKSLKKYFDNYNQYFNEIWLFNAQNKEINFQINVTHERPISYEYRAPRYVIHGGGWGMGTYQTIIPELEKQGILLDVVAYEMEETKHQKSGNRYFINDPSWRAWNKNKENQHEFPLFSEIKEKEQPHYSNREEYHRLYDVIKESRGIISKPGAGTLIDSLSSATPVIILDAFGEHEKRNAELWKSLGFGIGYSEWKNMNYDIDILAELHQNILNKKQIVNDYVTHCIEKLNDKSSYYNEVKNNEK